MENLRNKNPYLFWTLFVLSLSLIIFGVFYKEKEAEISMDEVLRVTIPPPDLGPTSYLVGEVNFGKVLIKKNGDFHLFPASLTKLMAGIIVLENFDLDEEIEISKQAVEMEGEEGGLIAGEKIKAGDLLKILLISSSNDAAKAFEQSLEKKGKVFADLMNEKARKLGLFNTAFFDASGLDRQGNFTSIEDLFTLSREIYNHYPYLGEVTRQQNVVVYSIDGQISHEVENTNILLKEIDNLWGGKTGSTPEAKDCLLTIYEFPFPEKDDKMVISIIVLNSSDRFGDTL
ncbi:MAG: hypothetical protein PHF45_01255, partial [Candidatus Pacebacteria bacterium]|nr:hypothetical protein [Candidatus Paceibacterota bacterium]